MLYSREVLTGFGLGASLMYFLDPARGARRRARLRDRLAHARKVATDAAGTTGRDMAHRTVGVGARLRASLLGPEADDRIVVERVRSRLGRVVSHPHAISVSAVDGVVTLSGPVLQAELPRLMRAVERVRGVRDVVDNLVPHEQAGNVPALQGGATPPGLAPDIWQREWSPTTRVVTGATGLVLAGYGVARRGVSGTLLAASGLVLLARAATNLEMKRLTGIGAGRRAVDVHKTISIQAPLEQVFAFWSRYENFPQFMSGVLDVRQSAVSGQSHWRVSGPGGIPFEFDAEISAFVPNQVIAWRTVEGAAVAHAGIIRFERAGNNRTRVDIRMSYNPPGGWLGHEVAQVFGADPKHTLDADLARLKTLVETGRPARDAAQPHVP